MSNAVTAPNTHGSLIRQHALAIADLAAKAPTDAILETIDHHTRAISRLQAEATCALHTALLNA